MAFKKGFDPNRGPGRRSGKLNEKTELIRALKKTFRGDGVTPFWEMIAQDSQGTSPCSAVCKRMIADRLSPTLKAVEVRSDGNTALQVVIARFTDAPLTPELPGSTSSEGEVIEGALSVSGPEVTPS